MKTIQQQDNTPFFTIVCERVSVIVRRNRRRITASGCEVL